MSRGSGTFSLSGKQIQLPGSMMAGSFPSQWSCYKSNAHPPDRGKKKAYLEHTRKFIRSSSPDPSRHGQSIFPLVCLDIKTLCFWRAQSKAWHTLYSPVFTLSSSRGYLLISHMSIGPPSAFSQQVSSFPERQFKFCLFQILFAMYLKMFKMLFSFRASPPILGYNGYFVIRSPL